MGTRASNRTDTRVIDRRPLIYVRENDTLRLIERDRAKFASGNRSFVIYDDEASRNKRTSSEMKRRLRREEVDSEIPNGRLQRTNAFRDVENRSASGESLVGISMMSRTLRCSFADCGSRARADLNDLQLRALSRSRFDRARLGRRNLLRIQREGAFNYTVMPRWMIECTVSISSRAALPRRARRSLQI